MLLFVLGGGRLQLESPKQTNKTKSNEQTTTIHPPKKEIKTLNCRQTNLLSVSTQIAMNALVSVSVPINRITKLVNFLLTGAN